MNEKSGLVPGKENLSREAKKSKDSTFDRVYKYYHSKSNIELTPDEITIMNRWEKAWSLLLRLRTTKQVAELLIKLCNVSRSTAYDDVRSAMDLFSDPRKDSKEAKRAIAEHALLRGADMAWKYGNLEMHHKYMKEYSEINGLKQDGSDTELSKLVKNLKPVQVILTFDVEDAKQAEEKLRESIIQDIDFKDMTDEDQA